MILKPNGQDDPR